MLTVKANNQFEAEKKYIVDVFLGEFLGLDYQIRFSDSFEDYVIELENGKKILIEDHFFGKFSENYLSSRHIPEKVEFIHSEFSVETDLPVIYGNQKIYKDKKHTADWIVCEPDIFASAFFMLTRWEEYVSRIKDEHNRFTGGSSLAFKNNFLTRPVVNEYLEFFWNILVAQGIQQTRKQRNFEIVPTHDIDFLFFPRLKVRAGFKRFFSKEYLGNLYKSLKYTFFKPDPYDTFDYFMDLSEKAGIQARFYFVAGKDKHDMQDYLGTAKFSFITDQIWKRGHLAGFHAGYLTADNESIWQREKDLLEEKIGQSVKEGRQHFLKFEVPFTWRVWEENQMQTDSTLGYHDEAGFRCGTCYEFPVFDVEKRTKLNIRERPLLAMDTTLVRHKKLDPLEAEKVLNNLKEKVKKYQGLFVFLWHNTSVNVGIWKKYKTSFEKVYYQHLQ